VQLVARDAEQPRPALIVARGAAARAAGDGDGERLGDEVDSRLGIEGAATEERHHRAGVAAVERIDVLGGQGHDRAITFSTFGPPSSISRTAPPVVTDQRGEPAEA
jgi:hypothetical protein